MNNNNNNEINFSAESTVVRAAENAALGASAAMSSEALSSSGRHNEEHASSTRNDVAAKNGFPSADSLLGEQGGRDAAGHGNRSGLDMIPGGCFPQPKGEGTSKGDLLKQGQLEDRGQSGIERQPGGCIPQPAESSGNHRAVQGKDLQVQPGEKTNKIEERPRVIECPGEGPNPKPHRNYEFNKTEAHRRIQELMDKLSAPVR